MSSRFADEIRQQAELQALIRRMPRDWQLEALHTIRTGSAPGPTPWPWVNEQREKAIQDVLHATDLILIKATKAAQRTKRKMIGEATRYGPAKASAILAELSGPELELLAVGRCRSLRAALTEAALRNPDELWRDERGGWRSLGESFRKRVVRCKRDCRGWLRDERGRRLPLPPSEI